MSLSGWLASKEREKLCETLRTSLDKINAGDEKAKAAVINALTFTFTMGEKQAAPGAPDGLWLGSRQCKVLGKLSAIARQRLRVGYLKHENGMLELAELQDYDVR